MQTGVKATIDFKQIPKQLSGSNENVCVSVMKEKLKHFRPNSHLLIICVIPLNHWLPGLCKSACLY